MVLRIIERESHVTLFNLENDHEFISKEYISIPSGKPKSNS